MVPRHGTRDDEGVSGESGGLGRILSSLMQFLAFCLLAAAALCLFGAVLLLPEYARLQKTQYQLACQQAGTDQLRALSKGYELAIAEVPQDAVLTKRLAMNELGYWPEDEVVVLSDRGPCRQSPATVVAPDIPAPPPPAGWVMTAAAKVENPPTKRGLILLSVLGLVAAVLLFPGGGRRRRPHADSGR
jgi:hypothetical protein